MACLVAQKFKFYILTSHECFFTRVKCEALGDSQILGTWTQSDCKLHNNSLELKVASLALHHWVTVLRSLQVMIATDNTTVVSIYPQTGRDPFPHPVTSTVVVLTLLPSRPLSPS